MSNAAIKVILDTKGRDIAWVHPDSTVDSAVTTLESRGVGALVVSYDGVELCGIVSERDIVRALALSGQETLRWPVSAIMTAEVETCTPDDTIAGAMARMTEGRFRHLPVMVESRLAGLISIGDVVKHRVGELELDTQQLLDYIHAR